MSEHPPTHPSARWGAPVIGPLAALVILTLVVLVAVGTSVAGCGISRDDQPREIAREAIPAQINEGVATTVTTLTKSGRTHPETLYLVRTGDPSTSGSEKLEAQQTDVDNAADAGQLPLLAIERLITLKPEELGQSGLINAIPPDTRVLSAVRNADGVLDLNLSGLGNVESSLQRLAVAQIVFTATGLSSQPIRAVRFSIDGQPAAVPLGEGTSGPGDPVSRDDYPRLLDQVSSTAPTPGAG